MQTPPATKPSSGIPRWLLSGISKGIKLIRNICFISFPHYTFNIPSPEIYIPSPEIYIPSLGILFSALHKNFFLSIPDVYLILLYKVAYQIEDWFVAIETDGLVGVENGVVVLEGVSLFVL